MGVKSVTPKEMPFLVDVSFAYPSRHDSSRYVRVNKTFELTSRLHAGKVFNVLCNAAKEMPFPHLTMEGNGAELAASHRVFDGKISESQRKHFGECPRAYYQEFPRRAILRVGDLKLDSDRVDSLRQTMHNMQNQAYGEAIHQALNGTTPVNPFMLGSRFEGENKGRQRRQEIPEVQGKFWMIVNCDVEVKRNLTEIQWPAKTVFDSKMEADKAACAMAEKHPGVRFAVLESVKDARVEMVTRKEVVTKDIVEPKLTVNRL